MPFRQALLNRALLDQALQDQTLKPSLAISSPSLAQTTRPLLEHAQQSTKHTKVPGGLEQLAALPE